MFADKKESNVSVPRTEKDMNMGTVIPIVVLTVVATFGFFYSGVLQGRPKVFMLTCVALAVVLIISFLYCNVKQPKGSYLFARA